MNGLISSVTNLSAPVSEWVCGGVPITMMCHMERRHGHMKPVIKKALVELDDLPFKTFSSQRDEWAKYDLYRSPGPIQFFTDSQSVELSVTLTLELLGADPRVSPEILAAAEKSEETSRAMGDYLHSPLLGEANAIHSDLQRERTKFRPTLCPALHDRTPSFSRCVSSQPTQCINSFDRELLTSLLPNTYGSPLVTIDHALGATEADFTFSRRKLNLPGSIRQSPDDPLKIGVVFCGRQAPGGHDFVAGVLDSLPRGSTLFGFVGGTDGLIAGHSIVITPEIMENYRGLGGFELLCRSADNLRSLDQYNSITQVCKALNLDGLLLLGGPTTATDAAYLAEYLIAKTDCETAIITAPLTISGSIRNQFVEATIGFDTAAKCAAQIVGQ
jgi:hypothetical protein